MHEYRFAQKRIAPVAHEQDPMHENRLAFRVFDAHQDTPHGFVRSLLACRAPVQLAGELGEDSEVPNLAENPADRVSGR